MPEFRDRVRDVLRTLKVPATPHPDVPEAEWQKWLTQWPDDGPAPIEPRTCPACGGAMVPKSGRYGEFWGCENYPKCRHTEAI